MTLIGFLPKPHEPCRTMIGNFYLVSHFLNISFLTRTLVQGSSLSGTTIVVCSAAFTPEKSPRYSFYRRLSGPQDQSGHEGAKKNSTPSYTRDRTRAVQPIAQRLPLELPDPPLTLIKIGNLSLLSTLIWREQMGLREKFENGKQEYIHDYAYL